MKPFCLSVLLLVCGARRAFQVTGHTMISAMLERLVREKFYYPQLQQILGIMQPFAQEQNHVFAESSVWFEDIFYKIDFVQFKDWHFQGEFLEKGLEVPHSQFAKKGLPRNSIPLTKGIAIAIEALKSTKPSLVDDHLMKCISLRGLVHMVQDLHQPMHTVSNVTLKFPAPQGDRGGNSFKIKHEDRLLHKFWDHLLGAYPKSQLPLTEENYARIKRDAEALLESLRRDPEVVRRANELDSAVWLREGVALAQANVYPDIEPDAEPSAQYIERGQNVIKRQMVVAALRLFRIFETTFTSTAVLDKHLLGNRLLEGRSAAPGDRPEQDSRAALDSGGEELPGSRAESERDRQVDSKVRSVLSFFGCSPATLVWAASGLALLFLGKN